MSSETTRPLRRERRAAELAARRGRAPARNRPRRRIGIGQVTVLSVLAGLAVIGLVAVLNGPKPIGADVIVAKAPAGIPAAGTVLGNAAAPVTIDLYEDFQCPACGRWGENVFPALVRNEIAAGSLKIAFHGFAFLGAESIAAERAAWAADRQGRFWDMWATIYANQGTRENAGAFSSERLRAMAEAIGLDLERFTADVNSAEARSSVETGVAEAARAGVNSTPSLLINGAPIVGNTYPEVSAAVAAALGDARVPAP